MSDFKVEGISGNDDAAFITDGEGIPITVEHPTVEQKGSMVLVWVDERNISTFARGDFCDGPVVLNKPNNRMTTAHPKLRFRAPFTLR